jgi:hypothetical protein
MRCDATLGDARGRRADEGPNGCSEMLLLIVILRTRYLVYCLVY